MRLRNAWAVAYVLAACVATFPCIKCDAEAGDSSDGPVAIRSEANVSAGGVNAAGVTLENPYKDDLQSAQTGARLFSAMNCDGCHGGGALGSIGPSLVDGRWHYGGADAEIFHSIFYGRAKGMPAYGGVLGSEGIWMIVTYLKSQPVPNVVPTTSYEDLATNATPTPNAPPLRFRCSRHCLRRVWKGCWRSMAAWRVTPRKRKALGRRSKRLQQNIAPRRTQPRTLSCR